MHTPAIGSKVNAAGFEGTIIAALGNSFYTFQLKNGNEFTIHSRELTGESVGAVAIVRDSAGHKNLVVKAAPRAVAPSKPDAEFFITCYCPQCAAGAVKAGYR